jgi:hypothetical protein
VALARGNQRGLTDRPAGSQIVNHNGGIIVPQHPLLLVLGYFHFIILVSSLFTILFLGIIIQRIIFSLSSSIDIALSASFGGAVRLGEFSLMAPPSVMTKEFVIAGTLSWDPRSCCEAAWHRHWSAVIIVIVNVG